MLSRREIESYESQGYLHIPAVFTGRDICEMERDHEFMTRHWASSGQGWTGPWRKEYMDAATEKQSQLVAMHDLHFYAASWMQAVTHPRLVEAMGDLLGPNVELHHSTMHTKPPETGHPFPMHQDWAFYQHQDGRYVDVLVHLDDTRHENGEIRFLAGSHAQGALEHITCTPEGPCTPHLPTANYHLKETIPVPARRGDVVCFNIFTVHGSYVNRTSQPRRLVRLGYRDPENPQLGGQSHGRPGLMVRGHRPNPGGLHPAYSSEVGALDAFKAVPEPALVG